MTLTIEQTGPFPVARLMGEWRSTDDQNYHDELHGLVTGPGAKLAIDLSGLNMLDSGGLSVLINLVRRARTKESRVVLVAPSPFVAGVFEVTRLDRWFDLCPDMQKAAEHLA